MTITREEMIKRLSERSGYYMKDVRNLLQCMDDVVFEALCEVSDEEDVLVQLVQGVKLQCVSVPERQRKDPRDQSDIVCKSTCKVKARFSRDFKLKLEEAYDNNKNG